ncbi:hypothetical protein [Candidatus Phycorickettsia trachydisci]|nr:hypothetical protein [Candidatus Phycorickettsia trachydisci]
MGKKDRLGARISANSGRLIPLTKIANQIYLEALIEAFSLLVVHATHQPYLEVVKELFKDENFEELSEEERQEIFKVLAKNVCMIIQKHTSLKLKINKDSVKKVLKFLVEQGVSPSYLLERIEDTKFRDMCGASREEIKNIKYNPECSFESLSCAYVILAPQACITYKILTGEGFTVMDMNKFLSTPYDLLDGNSEGLSFNKYIHTKALLNLLRKFSDPLLFKVVLRSIENKPLDPFEELLFKTKALVSFIDAFENSGKESELRNELVIDVSKAVEKFLTKHSTINDIKPVYKTLVFEASNNIAGCYLRKNDLEKAINMASSVLKVFPDAELQSIGAILEKVLFTIQTNTTYIDKALALFLTGDLKAELQSWIVQGSHAVHSLNVVMYEEYCHKKSRINELLNGKDELNRAINISFAINELFFYANSDFDRALLLIMDWDANPEVSDDFLRSAIKRKMLGILSYRHIYPGNISLDKMSKLEKMMKEESYQDELLINVGFVGLYLSFCWNDDLSREEKRKYLKTAHRHLDTAVKIFVSDKMKSCNLKRHLMLIKGDMVLKSMELGLSYKKNMYSIEKFANEFDLYHLFEQFSSYVESIEEIINKIKLSKIQAPKPIREVLRDNSLEIKESSKKIVSQPSIADEKSSASAIVPPKNEIDESKEQAKTLKRPIEEVIDEEPIEFTEDESRQIALALDQYYKKLKGAKKALQEREILGIKKVYVWNYKGEEITSSSEDVITIKEDELYVRFAPNFLNKLKKNPDLYGKLDYILREKGVAKDSESEGMIYLKNNYWKIRMSNKKLRPIGEETDATDDIVSLVTFFDIWSHQKMDDFISSGCKSLKRSDINQSASDSSVSAEEMESQDETMPFWPTEELGQVEVPFAV